MQTKIFNNKSYCLLTSLWEKLGFTPTTITIPAWGVLFEQGYNTQALQTENNVTPWSNNQKITCYKLKQEVYDGIFIDSYLWQRLSMGFTLFQAKQIKHSVGFTYENLPYYLFDLWPNERVNQKLYTTGILFNASLAGETFNNKEAVAKISKLYPVTDFITGKYALEIKWQFLASILSKLDIPSVDRDNRRWVNLDSVFLKMLCQNYETLHQFENLFQVYEAFKKRLRANDKIKIIDNKICIDFTIFEECIISPTNLPPYPALMQDSEYHITFSPEEAYYYWYRNDWRAFPTAWQVHNAILDSSLYRYPGCFNGVPLDFLFIHKVALLAGFTFPGARVINFCPIHELAKKFFPWMCKYLATPLEKIYKDACQKNVDAATTYIMLATTQYRIPPFGVYPLQKNEIERMKIFIGKLFKTDSMTPEILRRLAIDTRI